MRNELSYPFNSDLILKKKKSLKKQFLQEDGSNSRISKNIAILGGSTTKDIKDILELFLLNNGIDPNFYESEYAQYWQEAMFDNLELEAFKPDMIYIHTSSRNLNTYPDMKDSAEEIQNKLDETFRQFEAMWDRLAVLYHCPIIQNNFEPPYYRLMGNRDTWDLHGRVHFTNRLNDRFYRYAQTHDYFYINDIHYLSACYGLQKWADPFYWHMYKYALAIPAIPELAYNLANIIKSVYGKNKKMLVLDLDDTLWGGIIGDDGVEHIEIGQDTPAGQMYSEFQQYICAHRGLGILLGIASKNDYENATAGLSHPDSVLKPEDFVVIKANWNSKDRNILEIADEVNIGTNSIAFIDDNPAERHIVTEQIADVEVPELGGPETYINTLDRAGYFEITNFSEDDLKRNDMYIANRKRTHQQQAFGNYKKYLRSLEMTAEIDAFIPLYIPRIAQLTNKSNQFNLTTKRYTAAEIEALSCNPVYVTLYGKLNDKFGENGVVSVIVGEQQNECLHIRLWLMSCRVLKRNMELAMMDELVARCRKRSIQKLVGYYYPTAKNKIVKDFYKCLGFSLVSGDNAGNDVWELAITNFYVDKNLVIQINKR